MSVKNSVKIALGSSWSILGFSRGINSYDYKYIHNKVNSEKYPYRYSIKILYGCSGTFMYINPFFLCITIYKELYRFKVNMLCLEMEKQTDYYNEL